MGAAQKKDDLQQDVNLKDALELAQQALKELSARSPSSKFWEKLSLGGRATSAVEAAVQMLQSMPNPEEVFTTHDAAKMMHVDPSSVSKWIDRGILTAYRTPGGHRRIRRTDMVTFLKTHDMPIPTELIAQ
jgi:excisionase family DNA binding protein